MDETLKSEVGIMLQELTDILSAGDDGEIVQACQEQAKKLSKLYECEIFIEPTPSKGWALYVPIAGTPAVGLGEKHIFEMPTPGALRDFMNGFCAGSVICQTYAAPQDEATA